MKHGGHRPGAGRKPDPAKREQTLSEAQERMARVAVGLAKILTPLGAAQVLAVAAYGVIASVHGPDYANAFFSFFCEEIKSEPKH